MKRGRQPDPRRASIHRNYSIADAAKLFGVHRNTVNAWVTAGLRTFLAGRMRLILGEDLRAFLQARQRRRRQALRPGEMRCLPCRRSRSPDPALVDWASRNVGDEGGNLRALCPSCGCLMHRRIGRMGPEPVGFTVGGTQADSHLVDAAASRVNSAQRRTPETTALHSPSRHPGA